MKSFVLIMLGLLLLVGSIFVGFLIGSQTSSPRLIIALPTVTPTAQKEIKITGVLRTAGISTDEKHRFGLGDVKYQITDFGLDFATTAENTVQGYFLVSNNRYLTIFVN